MGIWCYSKISSQENFLLYFRETENKRILSSIEYNSMASKRKYVV